MISFFLWWGRGVDGTQGRECMWCAMIFFKISGVGNKCVVVPLSGIGNTGEGTRKRMTNLVPTNNVIPSLVPSKGTLLCLAFASLGGTTQGHCEYGISHSQPWSAGPHQVSLRPGI